MCDFCNSGLNSVHIQRIADGIPMPSTMMKVCFNCVTEKANEAFSNKKNWGKVSIAEDNFIMDKYGMSTPDFDVRVRIANSGFEYDVSSSEAIRLLGNCLTPYEHKDLLESGHSENELLLGNEFYSTDGLADQPLNEEYYVKLLDALTKELKTQINTRLATVKLWSEWSKFLKSDMDFDKIKKNKGDFQR